MIYYSERIQSKISKGKSIWGEVQEKPGTSFQESSPNGVTWDALNYSSSEGHNACEMRSNKETH